MPHKKLLGTGPEAHPALGRPGAREEPVVQPLIHQLELLHDRAGGQPLSRRRGAYGLPLPDQDAALARAAHDEPLAAGPVHLRQVVGPAPPQGRAGLPRPRAGGRAPAGAFGPSCDAQTRFWAWAGRNGRPLAADIEEEGVGLRGPGARRPVVLASRLPRARRLLLLRVDDHDVLGEGRRCLRAQRLRLALRPSRDRCGLLPGCLAL
mmetsp:Transcript_17702/g.54743  ORF Transcript_17702/g.54743 Transcript_17702/m.54743 type:complete len:207 (+) Transcript_17702:1218-1838(+)